MFDALRDKNRRVFVFRKNKFFADSGTIRHSRVGMQVEGNILSATGLPLSQFARIVLCGAAQNGEAEAKKFCQTAEKEKTRLETRIQDLDNIIRCMHEDRVCGRITAER